MKAIDLYFRSLLLPQILTKAGDKFISFNLDVSCEYLAQNSQREKRRSVNKYSDDLIIFHSSWDFIRGHFKLSMVLRSETWKHPLPLYS